MVEAQDLVTRAFEAIALARADDLAQFLQRGLDPEATNGQGFGLLTMASGLGRQREAKLLLARGAKVDRLDTRGYTALMYAAVKGHDGVVSLLLDAGAQVDLPSPAGLTALMFAASEGHSLVVRVLLERGAQVSILSAEGRTALHYAVSEGHTACVRRLVAHGARADQLDHSGMTALALAVQRGFYDIVELLGGTRPAVTPSAPWGSKQQSDAAMRQAFGVDPALKMLEDLARQAKFPGGQGDLAAGDAGTSAIPSPTSQGGAKDTAQSSGAAYAENAAKAIPTQPPERELSEEDFVGQRAAKDALRQVISVARLNQERVARKLPRLTLSLNAAFVGGPGTGKSSFARFYAEQIRKLGVLQGGQLVEASRADLVGEYKGQTPQKTRAVIERAKGGLLLIDDAPALKSSDEDSYGQECIDTLARAAEEYEGQLVLILAGPSREMRDFLHRHATLEARVPNIVTFVDFTDEELGSILDRRAKDLGLTLTPAARSLAMEKIARRRKGKNFGNAHEVRGVLDQALAQQGARLVSKDLKALSETELTTLIRSDFTDDPSDEGDEDHAAAVDVERGAMAKLDALIGLSGVKAEIKGISDFLRVQKARLGARASDQTSHMIFAGNPGTGKTTVARLLGELFHEIGLLPSGHLVECDRAGLVGQYVGQTALKTSQRIDEALGGVLFIDEAYALYRGGAQDDGYGLEAIDTLIKAMEDHRGRFVVVLAGYSAPMEAFLLANPGLKSRFAKVVHFDDYSPQELEKIARVIASSQGFTLSDAAMAKLLALVEQQRARELHFANAREVRNLLEAAFRRHASRVLTLGDPAHMSKDVLNTIEAEDVAQ